MRRCLISFVILGVIRWSASSKIQPRTLTFAWLYYVCCGFGGQTRKMPVFNHSVSFSLSLASLLSLCCSPNRSQLGVYPSFFCSMDYHRHITAQDANICLFIVIWTPFIFRGDVRHNFPLYRRSMHSFECHVTASNPPTNNAGKSNRQTKFVMKQYACWIYSCVMDWCSREMATRWQWRQQQQHWRPHRTQYNVYCRLDVKTSVQCKIS